MTKLFANHASQQKLVGQTVISIQNRSATQLNATHLLGAGLF
jgi:hypothetical protein